MQDAQPVDKKKLFVGNLSFHTTKETIEQLFSEHGTVTDLAYITDRMSGRFRGLAFVTFETEDQAQAAITALHGKEVDGREIVVNISKPRAPRTGGYNGRGNNNHRGGYSRDQRSY